METNAEPVLALRGITKAFGPTLALDRVDMQIDAHQVHGLLGENGSGKSTLIKILAGYYTPDSGTITVNGSYVKYPLSPGAFRRLGFSFVHQDLGLIPSLTVLENLRMGSIARRRGLRISWAKERRRGKDALDRFDLKLDLNARVERLAPTERALLAIVRAAEESDYTADAESGLNRRGRLLVLDEPTVFLPRDEVDGLFGLIRTIVADGASVLFAAHDLESMRGVKDVVTVIREV